MPGKKKGAAGGGGAAKTRLFFGKVNSSNLSMGIVGLPNVGKSSFFNVLTNSAVDAANYPFCTIDPSDAVVPVADSRLDWLVELHKPKKVVPATLTVTDIAGLVRGASEGKGLGSAFLANIQAVDGIYHVVRGFPSAKITHVDGSVDPVRDLETISRELILKDMKTCATFLSKGRKFAARGAGGKDKIAEFIAVERAYRVLRFGDPEGGPEVEGAAGGGGKAGAAGSGGKVELHGPEEVEVGEDEQLGKELRLHAWKAEEIEWLNPLNLLTAKPAVYLVNLSPTQYKTKKAKCLLEVKEWLDKRGTDEKLLPFSAAHESMLLEASEEERAELLKDKANKSALPKIIKEGYRTLHLINFFTAGPPECRAWTVREGTLAPKAAGAIHGDIEKGFICAETTSFDDLKEAGSESAVKAAGKLRTEGKAYVVKDGDIFLFKHN